MGKLDTMGMILERSEPISSIFWKCKCFLYEYETKNKNLVPMAGYFLNWIH